MSGNGSKIESISEANVDKPSLPKTPNDILTIRALNQVRLIEEKDEGMPVNSLPNGTYGFTYSPQDQSPIFSKRLFQIFEVHKSVDGVAQIIGYVSQDDLKALGQTADEFVSISLYPEPHQSADRVVGIPKSHILEHRGPSRENGNALKLKVEPISNAIQ
ncbi:MAG: hypothetical protein AB1757_19585 [Acidobacteriota bacterium]